MLSENVRTFTIPQHFDETNLAVGIIIQLQFYSISAGSSWSPCLISNLSRVILYLVRASFLAFLLYAKSSISTSSRWLNPSNCCAGVRFPGIGGNISLCIICTYLAGAWSLLPRVVSRTSLKRPRSARSLPFFVGGTANLTHFLVSSGFWPLASHSRFFHFGGEEITLSFGSLNLYSLYGRSVFSHSRKWLSA
jgi:hypothetical protein